MLKDEKNLFKDNIKKTTERVIINDHKGLIPIKLLYFVYSSVWTSLKHFIYNFCLLCCVDFK